MTATRVRNRRPNNVYRRLGPAATPVSCYFLFFTINLTLSFYLQVLSHNDTTTPTRVRNRPREFLFYFIFLFFMIQLTFTRLSTGLVSHRHDNTNEGMKQAPKQHVSSFGPPVSFYFLFFTIQLTISSYLQVLSHNDTTTPTRI